MKKIKKLFGYFLWIGLLCSFSNQNLDEDFGRCDDLANDAIDNYFENGGSAGNTAEFIWAMTYNHCSIGTCCPW